MNLLLYTKDSTYIDAKIGGAQTSIRLIGEELAKRGHNVFYLTKNIKGTRSIVNKKINGVNVLLYPRSERRTIKYYFNKITKGKPFAKKELNGTFKYFVKNLIAEKEISIIYTYYDTDALNIFQFATGERKIPIIMRMAGLKWYEDSKLSKENKHIYEEIFNSVNSINYNTPGLRRLVYDKAREIDFNYKPRHDFTADIGALPIKKNITSGQKYSNAFNILVATRFSSYQKRQDILVNAVASMPEPEKIRILMIGSGEESENIEELIKTLNLSQIIKIRPFATQKELWQMMAQFDLLCHPCEYEGLSKIIIESMMVGLPVMASNVLPLTDYIQHEKTGFLVKNSIESWANSINKLVENTAPLPNVATSAKRYAAKAFDPKKNAAILENHFQEILRDSA